ncbi:ATP-dependent DNA ligase [Streptomyces griseofuscus]|uniref:ATP-dependent DNA ligase n=2 Tax=Streptomyces griseofuscus TaxID=146922 RepID=UPI003678C751
MPDGRPDGYRAQLAVYAGGRVLLRSRRGTDMTAAFPEIKAAALTQLPADTGLDGELVVWEEDQLACERPQQRLARRDRLAAAGAARQWPAHYVAFDRVHAAGTDLTDWPYQRRRMAPEALFSEWLGWTAAWLEPVLQTPHRALPTGAVLAEIQSTPEDRGGRRQGSAGAAHAVGTAARHRP